LIEPSAARSVAIVSRAEPVLERVATIVARAGARLVRAETAAGVARVLEGSGFRIRILDRAAPLLAGADLGAPLWGRQIRDGLLMLVDSEAKEGASMVATAYRRHELGRLLEDLRDALPHEASAASPLLEGQTPGIRRLRQMVQRVARFRAVSVLVLGETGTGKERVAQYLHSLSNPREPFVAINCAAVPEPLFESELFGHEAGAYTGARGTREGLLETAAAGTVFLDEIGEMPNLLQAKLLRVLETRSFRRVGANRDLPLRARIVSATHRDAGPHDGVLRQDVFFRLAGFTLRVPALRDRAGDIDLLARRFLEEFRRSQGSGPLDFTDLALQALHAHPWRGNVRELRAVVEQAAIISPDPVVSAGTVATIFAMMSPDVALRESSSPLEALAREGRSLADIERALILLRFREHGGNVSRTAKALGIPRTTLRARLDRYRVV